MYRARPGVEPLVSWTPPGAQYDGYQTIAFPQDDGTLSALVVRPSEDQAWSAIWTNAAFEAAVAVIPNLAPWTDPERFEPITDVMRGGTLVNSYRGQGTPPSGLFWVGDAVCTTNPSAGRGMALGLLQAGALLDRLAAHDDDRDASADFDAWCTASIRPWFEDHVQTDASTLRSYAHQDLDPEGPLTPDVLAAALDVDPSLAPVVMPYLGMVAPPASLRALEPRVRELLRTGWRPPVAQGPGRDELLERMSLVPAQRGTSGSTTGCSTGGPPT
jgi:flavin-dependent dehydrogenase